MRRESKTRPEPRPSGLRPGMVTFLSGRPGQGKTYSALALVKEAEAAGMKTLYLDVEDMSGSLSSELSFDALSTLLAPAAAPPQPPLKPYVRPRPSGLSERAALN